MKSKCIKKRTQNNIMSLTENVNEKLIKKVIMRNET